MYEVTYSVDGVLYKATVNAEDSNQAMQMFTNMYGTGKMQIINIIRKG